MRRIAALAVVFACSCGSETVPGERPDPDILTPTGGNGVVTGRVVDSNGTPVPAAFVLIQSDPVEVTTNAGGTFQAEVPAGDHNVTVSKWGETLADFGVTVEPEETHDLGDVGPSNPFIYARMSVREAAYKGERFHQEHIWTALNIEDEIGLPVRGLTMEDFTVTDAIREIATGNVVASNVIDLPTQNANQFMEAGVWEHSRTREKLDVVFLVDGTASMSEEIAAVRDNIHDFVDRLQTANLDFRVGGFSFEQNPGGGPNDVIPFYGDWELDRLHEAIDSSFRTAGEGWDPTAAYDGLMLTEWLDYRDDARKVAVIITDIVPHTVYGTYWYTVSSSVMTASAIEQFIAEEEIELYYSKDPNPHIGIEAYVDPAINPRAGETESGLFGLYWRGFATQLPWPFDEVQLSNALGLVADEPVIDSQYLVEWEPVVGWDSPWSADPAAYEQFVTVSIDDPVRPGETLSASFTLPLETPTTDVTVNLLTEGGNDPDILRADVFRVCGGRPVLHSWQHPPSGGVISLQLTPGHYRIEAYVDSGGFSDTSLVSVGRADFEVGADPVSVDVLAVIAEARGELARTRGLLRDLDDWRISGDPFRDFVERTERWLVEDIEPGGISWEEMVKLRRFNVALAGYANLNEYAQLETESAVEDFVDIVADFREVVKQVKKIQSTTSDKWYTEVAGALLEIALSYFTHGEFTKEKQALELALDLLFGYAAGPLQRDLKRYIIDQFPPNLEILASLTDLTFALIDANFNTDGEDANWQPVIEAVQKIALDVALIAARETVVEDTIDVIMDEIQVEDQWEDDIKGLIRDILNSLVRRNHNIKDFQRALEDFARAVGNTLLSEDRETTIATINRMFDHVQSKLDHAPDVRDFLVGMARDLTLAALPERECNEDGTRCRVVYELNTDAIVEVLIRHGLYNVILRHYFVEEANHGLGLALDRAQDYTLPAGAPYDWSLDMHADFADYRAEVGDAQAVAWNALRQQQAVDEWANGLAFLTHLLDMISKPLDVIASVYPPLEDTAEAVHGFIIALDAIHITTQAVEFGLKVDCLCRFGNMSEDLYANAYPH